MKKKQKHGKVMITLIPLKVRNDSVRMILCVLQPLLRQS